MADEIPDLGTLLESGWTIEGYSVCPMELGTLSHHILLRNGAKVATYLIDTAAGSEKSREWLSFSPPIPKKKGWFG